ncbi:MAG: hypothetical protein HYZ00_02305, partial [Candidatus Hydrogenedentes bacterium]|nr:hypothetical protein [Candidatus Hydrogenedentota bacterium]
MQCWPGNKNEWLAAALRITIFSFLACSVIPFIFYRWVTAAAPMAGMWRWRLEDALSAEIGFIFLGACTCLALLLSVFAFACWQTNHRLAEWAFGVLAASLVFWTIFAPAFARAREKPVIYLYPSEETVVHVALDYGGRITSSYPPYGDDGWTVRASPTGDLVDLATGRQYYCLFWEGEDGAAYDLAQGFVVRGKDTAAFLESTLAQLGLTKREANEFIIYWLPRME